MAGTFGSRSASRCRGGGGDAVRRRSGLGLAVTKMIVEAQGREVGVRSWLGLGSTFDASIPAPQSGAAEAQLWWQGSSRSVAAVRSGLGSAHSRARLAQPQPRDPLMDVGKHGPVLVIEDHPINRLLLQRVLELEQIEVIAAGSIAEAEQVLQECVPPVIVLDLHLPDGYGLDLARRLKSEPATSGCAIVACTAGPVANEEALARAAGCTEYLTKPLDTRRFASLICSLIPAPAHH